MVTEKRGRAMGADITVMRVSSGLTVQRILDVLKSEKDVQAFDVDAVTGTDHIRIAFFHADRAFEEGRNFVRDRMLEVLLRAAAARQVADAVKRIGVKDPKRIVIGFKGDTKREKSLLAKLDAKKIRWGTIDREAEKKMIEKMVLLQLE